MKIIFDYEINSEKYSLVMKKKKTTTRLGASFKKKDLEAKIKELEKRIEELERDKTYYSPVLDNQIIKQFDSQCLHNGCDHIRNPACMLFCPHCGPTCLM